MANRKARSFIFNLPPGMRLGQVKNAIQEITADDTITVFEEISTYEYLVELTNDNQIQEIIEHGFDSGKNHINCHPPRGYYLNVSNMGLKVYVEGDEVIEKLSEYGELKGSVIRLKYTQDHELAGLENRNRLIRTVLTAQSIPYSLQIGGEWCRIIHNNQQLICTNSHEPGHSRQKLSINRMHLAIKHLAISPTTVQREPCTTRKQQLKIQPRHMITPRT